MSEQEYDLDQSTKLVGQLYPILEAKDGDIIDGKHRDQVDPNWKRIKLEHIDTPEKKAAARIIANKQTESKDAVFRKEINALAKIHEHLLEKNISVRNKIAELTGLSPKTVGEYLDAKYILTKYRRKSVPPPSKPASHVIETAFKSAKGADYAQRLIDRHREEVLEEERPKIERETAKKLLTSERFLTRMIEEGAPAVQKWVKCDGCGILTKGGPNDEGKILCSLCRSKETENIAEKLDELKDEMRAVAEKPESKEKAKILKNWKAHGALLAYLGDAFCPVCSEDWNRLVWGCHNINVREAHAQLQSAYQDLIKEANE